jgi:S-adenosylmethionine:tRNA ribosyltransferase-isomerase
VEFSDYERYQTVYAKNEGSVAAPTAGLHFTPQLLEELKANGLLMEQVTLHVGAGTFRPVKSETMKDHEMHKEWILINRSTIENILNYHPDDVIPVGTTSLRTLESLYWMGVKAFLNPDDTVEELEVKQWDPYELPAENISTETALQALIGWMNDRETERLVCHTQLLVAPGYKVRIADALITNFHQPNSTLLLLVAALIGDNWRKVYDYALENDFRFLSYGDGSLLWCEK